MAKTLVTASDLRGLSKLGFSAALGVTDLVEQMHATVARRPLPFGAAISGPADGVAGAVFKSVRGGMRIAGAGVDILLKAFETADRGESSRGRDIALAALNGVIGDRLVATGNPLALAMRLRSQGRTLDLDRAALVTALPNASGRIVVLVHGLCLSDLQWRRKEHDHGAAVADDLGYTPLHLFYNSGLHISENGRAFADLLQSLIREWPAPVEDLVIVGHSMGGLVARSACVYGERAGHAWRRMLRKLVFLGAPHHGAPLERIGAWVDHSVVSIPYTAPFSRLGRTRSAGVTDLRHGSILDEDWQGRDRFARDGVPPSAAPLPSGVACYALAGTMAKSPGGVADRMIGDTLVPVMSALGEHRDPRRSLAIPAARRKIVGGVSHLDLLSSVEVYATIRAWLGADESGE
jgi:pimeloyl-ACP methyl ester carboxylesterase